MPKITDLPEELISNIAGRLFSDDVAAFRLTCKTLERKSLHEFATEYFHEKCFMITTESLTVLVGIANSEKLRGYFHGVRIMTALFSDRAFGCPNGCNCAWQPTIKQAEAYRTYINDQKTLKQSGLDQEMLVDAFSKLPNLSNISIDDTPSAVPPHVDYRGGRKVCRVAGRPPTLAPETGKDTEYTKWFQHVWKILTQAIADSKVKSLVRFGVQTIRPSNGLTMSEVLFDNSTLAGLKEAFRSVGSTRLRISGRSSTPNDDKEAVVKRGLIAMGRFASTFETLEALDIAFDHAPACGAICATILGNIAVSKMTKLYVEGMDTAVGALGHIIQRLENIKDLRLSWINLVSGSWVVVLKALQQHVGHLEHLHLIYLMAGGCKVYFLKQPEQQDELDAENPWQVDGDDDDEDEDDDDSDYEDVNSDEDSEEDSEEDSDDDLPDLKSEKGAEVVPYEELPDIKAFSSTETDHDEEREDEDGGKASATEPSDTELPPLEDVPPVSVGPPQLVDYIVPSLTGTLPAMASPEEAEGQVSMASRYHCAPGDDGMYERGYYVCVQEKRIAEELPIFIEEYNIGESIDDMPPPFGGANAQTAGFTAFMNMLAATVPTPGVPTGFFPDQQGGPPPGMGIQTGVQNGQGNNGSQTAAGAGGGDNDVDLMEEGGVNVPEEEVDGVD